MITHNRMFSREKAGAIQISVILSDTPCTTSFSFENIKNFIQCLYNLPMRIIKQTESLIQQHHSHRAYRLYEMYIEKTYGSVFFRFFRNRQ